MILNQVKRLIAKDRLRFFIYEIGIAFLIIFFISVIESIIFPIELNPEIFGLIFYLSRALIVLLAIPITVSMMKRLLSPSHSDMYENLKGSAFKSHFMLYKISKSNFKYQLLYGILLLFLVFIPLNFFLYLYLPEMLLYQSISLIFVLQNSYMFIDNFIVFFVLLIVIQISLVIAEETIYRGFINKRGSEQFNRISAVFISAYSYGFLNLLYFLNPVSSITYNWFPIIWFIPSFVIGLILSLTTIRKKWLFPSIFAHSISNIIMISMIWGYLNGWDYLQIIVMIYIPILCLGLFLLIWQYKRIRDSISIGIGMLREYVKNDEESDETNNDKYFRIFFDILMGFLVFVIGLLITI